MLNIFSSFFKEEAVAGLDIGEGYITAACLFLEKDGAIRVENLGWVKIEPNTSSQAIASSIKKLWQTYHIPTHTVNLSLSSPLLHIKHFKYLNLSEEELKSTLTLDAEHLFQKPQKELAVDWHLYKRKAEKEGILLAVPREEVDRRLVISKMAGLYPIAVGINSTAISNLFIKLRPSFQDKAMCIINVAGDNADLAVLTKDLDIYPRSLNSPGIPWNERVSELADEIKDIFRYCQFKINFPAVEKIIFTGQASFDMKFREDITKSVDMPMEFWNPLKENRLRINMPARDIEACEKFTAPALGLAL